MITPSHPTIPPGMEVSIPPSFSAQGSYVYDIPGRLINTFSRLRNGHSLLPHHSFQLSLNSSPLYALHQKETICDFKSHNLQLSFSPP